MSTYLWPNDDGWPYPDSAVEAVDPSDALDDDARLLAVSTDHLFHLLSPLEKQVIMAHYGLDGSAPRSMKELHTDMGLSRAELRGALADGLDKLRVNLNA
ncbi:MAG: hypothetical protein ACRD12_10185 [Acidimicrobiales bacterium]